MATYEHPNPTIQGYEPGIVAGISALLIILVLAVAIVTRDTSATQPGTPSVGVVGSHPAAIHGGRLAVQHRQAAK